MCEGVAHSDLFYRRSCSELLMAKTSSKVSALLELQYGDVILSVLFVKPPEIGIDATEVAVDGDG